MPQPALPTSAKQILLILENYDRLQTLNPTLKSLVDASLAPLPRSDTLLKMCIATGTMKLFALETSSRPLFIHHRSWEMRPLDEKEVDVLVASWEAEWKISVDWETVGAVWRDTRGYV